MQVSVSTIVEAAIDLADMRYSSFIDVANNPTSEMMRYVNMAYKDLYNQVILSREPYYLTSYTINVVNATATYALPADMYKLWGVDLQLNSSPGNNQFLTLRNYMFKDRNKYNSNFTLPAAPFGQVYYYTLEGDNIKFSPIPSSSAVIVLRYSPNPVIVTDYATNLNFPPGGDEYMSITIAMYMLAKEETDTTQLAQRKQAALNTITSSFKDRDSGAPAYIVDDSQINAGAWFPFLGGY